MGTLPFWSVHAGAVAGVVWLGWSWSGLGLALALYYVRMFFVTAGYHRYFAHRTFKTSRTVQLLLAVGGTLAVQRGVLWWAANHRVHHASADRIGDPHSPVLDGLWAAHVGWILEGKYMRTNLDRIRDFARYPELRWLDRHFLLPPLALAIGLSLVGGAWAVVWGFLVSTVLLWHGTFCVNSLAHRFGRRRYDTDDDSRNHFGIALLTMGEGWHNNHHRYPAAANQGFFWWELDSTYYALKLLAALGVVWDLRRPPPSLLVRPHQHGQKGALSYDSMTR